MAHVTLFDFMQMLGPDGMRIINEYILQAAAKMGLVDTSVMMSDTTAQEAKIPYPNEVGLMGRFMKLVSRAVGRVRGRFDGVKKTVKEAAEKVAGLVRNAHLFAKTKEQKGKIERKIYHTVREIQTLIAETIAAGANLSGKAAGELDRVNKVMGQLLPQIWHFLSTGFVAPKKIIHLQIPELYSIVRGKAGKKVEFGLKWALNRIGCGFLCGFLMGDGKNADDTAFCRESVKVHAKLFGKAPEIFGFDRGGYSAPNIKKMGRLGVKHVGIAPRGDAPWAVSDDIRDRIKIERARVEGAIGTVKCPRFGFNKPHVRSKAAMERCGHKAILGFNLRKLVKEWAAQQEKAAA